LGGDLGVGRRILRNCIVRMWTRFSLFSTGPVLDCYELCNECLESIKDREFLYKLSDLNSREGLWCMELGVVYLLTFLVFIYSPFSHQSASDPH
jgi:hypothetical protein